jgi:hypothetical protein
MVTKKTPIEGKRVQTVIARRAEPGAASLIIPRRGVLTGAALVLAASAGGCNWGKQKLLRTQFMADFTATFIGDPTKIKDPAPPPAVDSWPDPHRIWPAPQQKKPDIVSDYATFVNVLLTVGYELLPLPTFASGTLGDKIVQFLQAKNWPATDPVPTEYQGELPTVHLVEIAVISDRLLQAMNSFNPEGGAGGGPTGWPPH